jgi:hypothetical protein
MFLIFTALWAQTDFLNLMITSMTSSTCQITLICSTTFDQMARVTMEQYLLWAVGHETKVTTERLTLQAFLVIRLVAGGLFVGFTRPQFEPVCVARSSLLPAPIMIIALDAIVIGVLVVRASSLGMFRDLGDVQSSTRQEQSRALLSCIAGFSVWTAVGRKLHELLDSDRC